MEESSLLSVLISWFPMLLLLGIWAFFMRKVKSTWATNQEMVRSQIEAIRQLDASLVRIAAALEKSAK